MLAFLREEGTLSTRGGRHLIDAPGKETTKLYVGMVLGPTILMADVPDGRMCRNKSQWVRDGARFRTYIPAHPARLVLVHFPAAPTQLWLW
jgi:hypothetical protein